jgi:predicted nucleic acid-binding protein
VRMWSGDYPAMTRSSLRAACDAGPLIHLDEVGCLDLLSDFQAVLVPEQVWQEVEHHRPGALSRHDLNIQRVSVDISEDASFQALVRTLTLDLGEQAALSLMELHPDAILLTDDAAARLAANGLGYRAHGSIGILLRAIRRQQRTPGEVLSILRDLPIRSTLHIRSDLLQEIIAQVEGRMATDPNT